MPRGSKPGERRGGRKKGVKNATTTDIKAVASLHGKEAIDKLVSLMKGAGSEQVQVAAAREILDRAYGKASQAVTVDPGDTFTEMLNQFLGDSDGKTRGLPRDRQPVNGSGMASGQPVLHSGRNGAGH